MQKSDPQTTAVLPENPRKNGKHWLCQDNPMASETEVWTWRAGVRHWERRGRLRTPEAMAQSRYRYVSVWTKTDAPEDVDA